MDSFRTIIPAAQTPFQISHSDGLLLLGSCFSEHIGQRLHDRKFQAFVNPNGIVYNPVSMAQCLERLLAGNQPYLEDQLVENMGLWHSWSHHGQFSHPVRSMALQGINQAYEQFVGRLEHANVLLLTLGTAEVFRLLTSGETVANNHKMPANLFQQKRLSVAEVTETMAATLEKLFEKKPGLRVILNVSPVRHLRNGLVENQRSKAVLLLACEALCQQFPQVHYFPSYELLVDDLRDYRFYAADMLHPSEVAVDYIWAYFSRMFFSSETRDLNTAIEKIQTAAQHRPFHPDTAQHRNFAQGQIAAIKLVQAQHPNLAFAAELEHFEKVLQKRW